MFLIAKMTPPVFNLVFIREVKSCLVLLKWIVFTITRRENES